MKPTAEIKPSSAATLEFSVISGSNEDLILACLDSLYADLEGRRGSWQVTATCNTPGTDLSSRLRARFPGIRIIENRVPRGFAANHNEVLRASRADYVWLLNDDLIIRPGTVISVTDYMERPGNERVAVVSPRLMNPDGSIQPSTYGFPSMPQILVAHSGLRELALTERLLAWLAPLLRKRPGTSRYWPHDRTLEVETLRGACVALRMDAVGQVGVMTEVALVGAEEAEWHRRFHAQGWKVVFLADAEVVHYGSQTISGDSPHHYPEYLKGALHYFRGDRSRAAYVVLCLSLAVMFAARHTAALVKGDHTARDVLQRYMRTAIEGLRDEHSASPSPEARQRQR